MRWALEPMRSSSLTIEQKSVAWLDSLSTSHAMSRAVTSLRSQSRRIQLNPSSPIISRPGDYPRPMNPICTLSAAAPAAIFLASCGFLTGCTASSSSNQSSTTAIRAVPRDPAQTFAPLELPPPTSARLITGEPGPGYWQQRADYRIDAVLDETTRSISARCVIRYTNNSPDVLPTLYLHLEQNLFRPDSQGARKFPSESRWGNRDGFEGGFTISSVTSSGQTLAMAVDDTIGRIDLPVPLSPRGGTAELTIDYSFRIPDYGADRLGVENCEQGPVFQIAQWFPAMCKYDDVSGWNTMKYLGQGEFYTDFGSFDVNFTAPRSHIVAATGVLLNPQDVLTPVQLDRLARARSTDQTTPIVGSDDVGSAEARPSGDGPLVWKFHADNVRTFALASSAAFLWDAATITGLGENGGGTLAQSFYPKEGSKLWSASGPGGGSTHMLKHSIEHYSRTWFPYPYPTASNINGIVGGMEYPMMIFCRARGEERDLYGVTTHEIGHTWFPMIVNSDERRYPWMDEGFNTFVNQFAVRERFGSVEGRRAERGDVREFATNHQRPFDQPIMTYADDIPMGMLGTLAYGKTSIGLLTLRDGVLGPERFDAAFREYIRRWAFKSPQPADFFRTIENVTGQDLAWFWREWFYGREVLDIAVTNVEQAGAASPVLVSLENRGGMVMPVVVRVKTADGASHDVAMPASIWRPGDNIVVQVDSGGGLVERVTIDPEEVLPDVEPRNNVWSR